MKRLFAIILAVLMVLSLAACGGDDAKQPGKETEQPGSNTEQAGTQNEASGGQTLEATLWTLNYDPDVWTYEEDDFNDGESWSDIMMIIPDGEDSYITNVEIRVAVDNPEAFRDYLTSYGFDEYEYAVNNAYELINVGGVDCLTQEGNYWGEPCLRYFGRVENAGVTVFIEIVGEYEDARVDQLLSGLTFTLTDIGYVDGPWHWEGERFTAEDSSNMVGTYTVNAQWIPFAEYVITKETFNHAVAVCGDQAFILSDGVLKQYAYDGESLTFEGDVALDGEFGSIQAAADGTIWLSEFMEPLTGWKDGAQTASYDGPDYVAMHPSGAWGISWFSGPECEKITISGGTMSTSAMNFAEVSTIMHLNVDEDYIYVCGSAADESGHKVFVYNSDGELQMTLADADGEGMGSITFMAHTANGFIGLDGNMREIVLWTNDGTYIGAIDDGDLFGTDYPWFCGGTKLSDGSILVIMTENRADDSGMELVAFKLSGF